MKKHDPDTLLGEEKREPLKVEFHHLLKEKTTRLSKAYSKLLWPLLVKRHAKRSENQTEQSGIASPKFTLPLQSKAAVPTAESIKNQANEVLYKQLSEAILELGSEKINNLTTRKNFPELEQTINLDKLNSPCITILDIINLSSLPKAQKLKLRKQVEKMEGITGKTYLGNEGNSILTTLIKNRNPLHFLVPLSELKQRKGSALEQPFFDMDKLEQKATRNKGCINIKDMIDALKHCTLEQRHELNRLLTEKTNRLKGLNENRTH